MIGWGLTMLAMTDIGARYGVPVWRKMAAALAVILAETPGARLNVAEVLRLVQRHSPEGGEQLQRAQKTIDEAGTRARAVERCP